MDQNHPELQRDLQERLPSTIAELDLNHVKAIATDAGGWTSHMWNDTDTPLAFFISFCTYGTWLHGDKRGSTDRIHNQYGSPFIDPNEKWRRHNEQQLKTKPLILNAEHRQAIGFAIRDTCRIRKWSRLAFNVRTNHVHTGATARWY